MNHDHLTTMRICRVLCFVFVVGLSVCAEDVALGQPRSGLSWRGRRSPSHKAVLGGYLLSDYGPCWIAYDCREGIAAVGEFIAQFPELHVSLKLTQQDATRWLQHCQQTWQSRLRLKQAPPPSLVKAPSVRTALDRMVVRPGGLNPSVVGNVHLPILVDPNMKGLSALRKRLSWQIQELENWTKISAWDAFQYHSQTTELSPEHQPWSQDAVRPTHANRRDVLLVTEAVVLATVKEPSDPNTAKPFGLRFLIRRVTERGMWIPPPLLARHAPRLSKPATMLWVGRGVRRGPDSLLHLQLKEGQPLADGDWHSVEVFYSDGRRKHWIDGHLVGDKRVDWRKQEVTFSCNGLVLLSGLELNRKLALAEPGRVRKRSNVREPRSRSRRSQKNVRRPG